MHGSLSWLVIAVAAHIIIISYALNISLMINVCILFLSPAQFINPITTQAEKATQQLFQH